MRTPNSSQSRPTAEYLYVANEDAGTAVALDLSTGKTLATFVVGTEPEGVAINPNGQWAYVTAETSNSVSVIDTKKDSVVSSFLVDVRPRAVAWAPDGARVYVANGRSGHVSILDARTLRDVGVVTVGRGADLLTATGARGQRRGIRGKAGR